MYSFFMYVRFLNKLFRYVLRQLFLHVFCSGFIYFVMIFDLY